MIGQQKVPPDVLAKLREIDVAADLVHLDGREWLLGVHGENSAAKARVQDQLKAISDNRLELTDAAERAMIGQQVAREFEVLQLCAKGFRPIHLYRVDDTTPSGFLPFKSAARRTMSWGEVIEDFRLRDWNWRHRPEAAFRELHDELSLDRGNDRRAETLRSYVSGKANDVFRRVFRAAKSFAVGINLRNAHADP